MSASLDFVVVGAQRAGSTQLSELLRDHPDVFLPPDEVPFFEDPFFGRSSPTALVPLFEAAAPGQAVGIHCPSYLARSEVAGRLAAFAPEAQVLVVLRDPVARAVSAYFWYVQFGMLPLEPVEVGLARLLDGWSHPSYPQAWEILDWSCYGQHLQRYVDLFGDERILVVRNDELNSAATHRELYRFLGVDDRHHPASGTKQRNAGVYELRRLRWLRARRRFAWSWADTSEYTFAPRRLRRPFRFLPNAAVVAFDRLVLAPVFGNGSPAVPAELEARLRAYYADDLELLESLTDRQFSGWRAGASDRQPPPAR